MLHSTDGKWRWIAAVTLSLAIHLALLFGGAYRAFRVPAEAAASVKPMVIKLPPAEPRSVVETHEAAKEPPQNAAHVSDRDARALNLASADARQRPRADRHADFDEPGSPPTPPPQQARAPAEEPVSAEARRPPSPTPAANPSDTVEPSPDDSKTEPAHRAQETQLAQAENIPIPPDPAQPPQTSRGSIEGGVSSEGFLQFEAIRDEVAPYLLEIRKKVELRWRALLVMQYSGATPTTAIIRCAIRSDGRLVFAEITAPGDSPSYAALCKEAIQRAAPFGPFPFKVPDLYRSQNLDITWTFHFLE